MPEFCNELFDLAAISEGNGRLRYRILGVILRQHSHQAGDLVVLPLRIMNPRRPVFFTCTYLPIINRYRNGAWRVGRRGRRQLVFFPKTCQMVTLTSQFVSYARCERLYMSAGDLEFQHFSKRFFGILERSVVAAEVGDLSQEYRRVILRPEFK